MAALYLWENTWYVAKNEKVAKVIAGFPEQVKMSASYKDEFFNRVNEPVSKDFEVYFKKGMYEKFLKNRGN